MIDASLLESLMQRLAGSETPDIELKAAHGGFPNSAWETISAFANTSGGWLLLGVAEKSSSELETVGVQNASKMLDDFYSALRNPNKVSYSACGANDAEIIYIDDKEVIVIRVPETPRQQRPVYIKGNSYIIGLDSLNDDFIARRCGADVA